MTKGELTLNVLCAREGVRLVRITERLVHVLDGEWSPPVRLRIRLLPEEPSLVELDLERIYPELSEPTA